MMGPPYTEKEQPGQKAFSYFLLSSCFARRAPLPEGESENQGSLRYVSFLVPLLVPHFSGTLHKGTAGAKRGGDAGSRQAAYYVKVKASSEMLRNQGVGLSEVSLPVPSCSDAVLASMPSFFMRVMNVVRLGPSRLAAPFGPPMRPSVSFSARMI